CCTSGNAIEVVESLRAPKVIFLPDEYLALNIARQTKVEIIAWKGHCEVHERFSAEDIRDFRENHPGVIVLAHPECRPEVIAAARGRAGDLTPDTVVPAAARARGVLNARRAGVVAGLEVAATAFRQLDPDVRIEIARADGATVGAGERIAAVSGRARGLLSAERVALNFLCHLSGIATATREIVEAVKGYRARIACTRKTTPGLRTLEKYAVRV